MRNKTIKTITLLFSFAMLGACADMAKMKETHRLAQSAMEKATEAYNLAQTASTTANEASYNASQAQSGVESALACCNDNSVQLDRMFEKAMLK